MTHWIHHCTRDESPVVAAQVMGVCYIPWAPAGGRHVMDDFGWLQQTLPQHYYEPDPILHNIWYHFNSDLTYFYH